MDARTSQDQCPRPCWEASTSRSCPCHNRPSRNWASTWTSSNTTLSNRNSAALSSGFAFNMDERFQEPSGISTTWRWPPDQVKEDNSGRLSHKVHTSISTPMRVAASNVSEEAGKVSEASQRSTLMLGKPFHQDKSTPWTTSSPLIWSLSRATPCCFHASPYNWVSAATAPARPAVKANIIHTTRIILDGAVADMEGRKFAGGAGA